MYLGFRLLLCSNLLENCTEDGDSLLLSYLNFITEIPSSSPSCRVGGCLQTKNTQGRTRGLREFSLG
jgi:hypothetical protein